MKLLKLSISIKINRAMVYLILTLLMNCFLNDTKDSETKVLLL